MSNNDWRRQKVEDHKFDFIDVEDYVDNSIWRKFKYSLVFAIVIKGILIYCADLWTAVNLLVTENWSSDLGVGSDGQISFNVITISFEVYKWIFAGCILLSFFLLAWDVKKAVVIIQSHDISYALTSMIAYRYYAIKSYAHFCLFQKIHNSKKQIDEVAFFCFFTFRGWKRLMFADGPRQVINGIILITVVTKQTAKRKLTGWDGDVDIAFWTWHKDFSALTRVTMGVMTFTLTLWVISVLLMLAAVIVYIPLVIHIQGNLKEYCCHKIDKRIEEIIRKKAKQRAQDAAKNSKNGKNDGPLGKPTLPSIGLIEEGGRNMSMPGSTPRMPAAQPQFMAPGSPGLRPNMSIPNDPYRRQQPPRPYSPGPRSYTPTHDDDDTRPLRQDNHQQAYHNRNLRRQDQHYDFDDSRSEISDGAYSVASGGGGYLAPGAKGNPHPYTPQHRRQNSDTSTVLSGSNQGSVVSGYGPRSGRPHPLQQGHVPPPRNGYGETVMMNDLSHRSAVGGNDVYNGGHHGGPVPTGLGGGLGYGGGGSVINGPAYSRPHTPGGRY